MSTFERAVTETGDVDPGYLGLYVVMAVVLGAIPAALVLALVHLVIGKDHPLDLLGIAAVISAAGVAFGGAAAGVGLFRRGDQPHPNTITTTATQQTVQQTVPPAPVPVTAQPPPEHPYG